MQVKLKWTQGMMFESSSDGQLVMMDAKSPIGSGKAMTPKELVGAGLGGCTAMDVAALLKKHKQDYQSFEVTVDITTSTGVQPMVFTEALITFSANGNLDGAVLLESVRLSQTKYCGVSKMLLAAFPIRYEVILNGEKIGDGRADFAH